MKSYTFYLTVNQKSDKYLSEKIKTKILKKFPIDYAVIIIEELRAIDCTEYIKNSIIWTIERMAKEAIDYDFYEANPDFERFVINVCNKVIEKHEVLKLNGYKKEAQ